MININDTIFDIYSTGNVLDIETGDGEYVQRLFAYSEPYTENTVFELNPNDAEIKLPDVLFSTNKEFNLFIWSGDTDGNHSVNTYGCEINTRVYLPEEETEDDDLGDDEIIEIEPDEPEESPPEETDEKEGESDGNLDFDEDSIIEEVTPPVDDLENIPPLEYPEDIPSDDLTEDEELVDGETSNETDIQMPENYDPTGNLGSVIRTYTGTEFEAEVQQYYDYAADNNAFVSQVECEVIAEDERKKYVTDITDGGITVHADGDSKNFLRITDTTIDIVKNNKTVASYGNEVVLKAVTGSASMKITSEAVQYWYDNTKIGSEEAAIVEVMKPNGTAMEPRAMISDSNLKKFIHSASDISLVCGGSKITGGTTPDWILSKARIDLSNNDKVIDLIAENINVNGVNIKTHESAKSAWFTPLATASNGATITVTNRCTYNPVVGLFLLNLVVVIGKGDAGTWYKVGTVASGYRPPYATALSASHNTATNNTNTHGAFAYVNTSGEVYIKRTTSATSSFTTVISGMYLL